jgi:predicted permease
MAQLLQNLRYTFRILRRSPGFTSVALLSLALGIGANVAIFTVVNALLFRDLPVRQPDRLVELSAVRSNEKTPFSYPMFQEVERGQRVFSDLIGWSAPSMVNTEVNGVLGQSSLVAVTGNYYSSLGVSPRLGRLLASYDVEIRDTASTCVVVIGYGFWQRRFGGVPDILGRLVHIEGRPFTVVGVTPKGFTGMTTGEPPDLTIPITAEPLINDETYSLGDRSKLWVFVTGRLKDGVSLVQARSQLLSFWPEVLKATASTQTPGPRRQAFLSMAVDVVPVRTGVAAELRSRFSRPLFILSGIVGLILLIACVNLANLMLARAAARTHEMSVRVAIGASRSALASQTLTESLVLSLAGAILGLVFSYWCSRLLVTVMTEESVSLDLRPDLRVLSVAVCMAILTGTLFGLVPAWQSRYQDPASVLQHNLRTLSGRVGGLTKILVIAQVALSLVLLMCAGLLTKSFQRLRSINLGFDKDNLLGITLNPMPGGYAHLDMNSYHRQLIDHLATVAGVRAVCFSDVAIPNPRPWRDTASAISDNSSTPASISANATMVSRNFFRTFGIRLLSGRDFDEMDDDTHARVAIVSSSVAEKLFPNGEALGRRIRFGFLPDFASVEIIGIASNARVFDIRNAAAQVVYFSYLQYPEWAKWGAIYVRSSEAPNVLSKAVAQEIESLGHEYALRTRTLNEAIGSALVEEHLTTMLAGFFAGLNLLLASVGLYGLMSYAVTRRTREVAIRLALGAAKGTILWELMRDAVLLTLAGIVAGVPCGLLGSRLVGTMLFEVSASDWTTLTGASLLLIAVTLIAGYLPAQRIAARDPILSLRAE